MQRQIDDIGLPPPPRGGHRDFDDIGLPPPPGRGGGFSARHALLTFALTTFVLGGFSFGWLFLANWRIMLNLQQTQVRVPGGPIIQVPVPVGGGIAPRPTPAPGGPVIVSEPAAPAQKPEETADLPGWSGTSRHNILLLGIDHREDEPIDGSRSDTIMVVSYDPTSSSAVMVSLPRDLWVNIPGYYPQRLNVAHSVGGPELVKRTIQANFGITVHNYARVNFRGFEKVVDTLGGVIVDVERPIKDDEYPTEDYGVMRLFIPAGPQLMDGRMALMYARSRHSENDFGRARRQQRVIMAIRDRALALNMLPKFPSIAAAASEAVSTDIGTLDMVRLASSGSKIERDKIKSVVVDATYATPFKGPNGEDLLQPNRQAIQGAIQKAFAEAEGKSARIEVLNGATRDGVARQLADSLARVGYEVTNVAPADRRDHARTTITILGSNRRAAQMLARQLKLPDSAILEDPTPGEAAELRIIVGNDFQIR